jgi:hypothetical protein
LDISKFEVKHRGLLPNVTVERNPLLREGVAAPAMHRDPHILLTFRQQSCTNPKRETGDVTVISLYPETSKMSKLQSPGLRRGLEDCRRYAAQ